MAAARIIFGLASYLFVVSAWSATPLRFNESELPQETVLPVFERPDVVMNRAVVTAKRFEIGLLGGWTPTDPFFAPFSYGVSAGYHFTETHGLNVVFANRLSGTTEYSSQLNNVRNVAPLRLQNGPSTQYVTLLNYQASLLYGKMSFSKSIVGHLTTLVTAGAGVTAIGNQTLPIGAVGLGQKYYLTSSFGLRLDARLLVYEGPDLVSVSLSNTRQTQPNSAFAKRMFFDTMINLSAIFMFPGS